MQIKDAIILRLKKLCEERHISFHEMSIRSGVTSSTVYTMMDQRVKGITVGTLKKLCDGLNITLQEFFTDPIFDELEQEIK